MHCKNWKTILPFAITFLIGVFIAENRIENLTIQNNQISSLSFPRFGRLKFEDRNCQDNYNGVELNRLFKVKNNIESKIRFLKIIDSKSNELLAYQKKRDDLSKHIENKIRSGNDESEVKGMICYFPEKLCDEE